MQISEYSPYQNFVFALKSKDVKRQYPAMLSRFFDFINLEGQSLQEKCKIFYDFASKMENRKMLESQLMHYISFQEERVKIKKEIAAGTLRNYVKALKLFLTMNDIVVNWSKIKMGMPPSNQTSNDRIPEISEINQLLQYPDNRIKPIVLVMLSSGIRVGSWNYLKWKHVIPLYNNNDKNNNDTDDELLAAKLIVYAGEPEQYYTFISTDAYHALADYIKFRELHGEKITGESWLIRDQWQKVDKEHGHRIGLAGYPRKFDAEGIRRLIYDAWKIQGVITVVNNNNTNGERTHPFKSSHGFRKFFQTKCEQVIKSEDVEILMGHGASRRGLKANYYRPNQDYLLDQYLKCVDLLTLDQSNPLSKQIKELKEKNEDKDYLIKGKLQEKDEQIKALQDSINFLSDTVNRALLADPSNKIITNDDEQSGIVKGIVLKPEIKNKAVGQIKISADKKK